MIQDKFAGQLIALSAADFGGLPDIATLAAIENPPAAIPSSVSAASSLVDLLTIGIVVFGLVFFGVLAWLARRRGNRPASGNRSTDVASRARPLEAVDMLKAIGVFDLQPIQHFDNRRAIGLVIKSLGKGPESNLTQRVAEPPPDEIDRLRDGVNLAAETGGSVRHIIDRVVEINAVVAEIAASAERQASGLQEFNSAVDQSDQVTQQNAALIDEASAATRGLMQQSAELAQIVARFTLAASSAITAARQPMAQAQTKTKRAAGGGIGDG